MKAKEIAEKLIACVNAGEKKEYPPIAWSEDVAKALLAILEKQEGMVMVPRNKLKKIMRVAQYSMLTSEQMADPSINGLIHKLGNVFCEIESVLLLSTTYGKDKAMSQCTNLTQQKK